MNEKTLKILEFDKIIKKLADFASSPLGREVAEGLLPDFSILKIEESLKETSDGVDLILKFGNPPMGGVHDIRPGLRRCELGAVLNPGELLKIADSLRACRNLKNYIDSGKIYENNNIVFNLINCLESHKKIEDKIFGAVINDYELSDNASPVLFNIRKRIRDLENSIKEKLSEFVRSSKYQKFMQESIVTMRGERYVVPVKQEHRSDVPGLVHDASASGATIFIEPMAVVEANNNIKHQKIKEQEEIEKILHELTVDVIGIIDTIKSNISILTKLDFIFAKAKFSLQYNCMCPKINTNKQIVLKKARHPLIEPRLIVPIDFWIGKDFTSLIVTGPNTGGKTVTLKTVGLFVLMAQAGLHLPSGDGTEVCVFDKVFADIGDEQSIEQSLSTFSSHMKNIINILENIDSNSLVLFDELGAGTDPVEGSALAMAILETVRNLGVVSVATTHYSELKFYALSTDGVENACCEFDVETLRPTYNLLIGIPGRSNAFAISERLGLDFGVIKKAKEFLTAEDIRFEDMLKSIEANLNQSKAEKMKAESYRLEIEKLMAEHDARVIKLKAEKEQILRAAKEEAGNILSHAKVEVDSILSELKKITKENYDNEARKNAQELRIKLVNKINETEESLIEPLMPRNSGVGAPQNLKPGDDVSVINLNQNGVIINPPDKDGEALVQVGIMKINVHISNLRRISVSKTEIAGSSGSGKIGVTKVKSISAEIDLRGYTLDDALEAVDKYIDDAFLSGLFEVTVIHGKGSGVLRSGMQKFFKTHSHVRSFRPGVYGEGEMGVTIVQLK